MLIFSQGTNITVMSFRHSSRVKLVVIPLALLAFQAIPARAQGGKPNPPSVAVSFTDNSVTFTFGSVGGATSYDVQVSDKQNMSNVVGSGSTSDASVPVMVTGLQSSTKYYYEATVTVSGTTSNPTKGNFTTHAPPGPPPPQPPPAPAGLSATPTTTGATLSWGSVSGATSYVVEVHDKSNYTSLVWSDNPSSNSTTASGLASVTKYYWRVKAQSSGGESGWSTSSFTTSSPPPPQPPPAPTGLAASQITTDGATLSWSSSTGATSYNVQLSDKQNFQDLIEARGLSGTSTAFTGLAGEKTYYWRVSATNSGGTSPWTQASFTTLSTRPNPPTGLVATNITSTSATLDWFDVSVGTYDLEYSTDRDLKKDVVQVNGLTRARTGLSGLLSNTMYYWHVRVTTSGGTSNWSSISNFTTANSKPAAPTGLLSVPDATRATLTWFAVGGATSYDVEVATKENFGNSVVVSVNSQTTTASVPSLQPSTKYYWHVRTNVSSNQSDWSSPASFTTLTNVLAAPALIYPDDKAANIPTSLQFQWRASTGATSYEVQWTTDKKFEVGIDKAAGIVSTFYAVGGLSGNTDYYWRARANGPQGSSAWSAIWGFRTASSGLSKPTLVSPQDMSANVPANVQLLWNSTPGAVSYDLQWTTNKKFEAGIAEVRGVNTLFYSLGSLTSSTDYYWRVRANGAQGSSEWSAIWSFTTAKSQLAQPQLVSPDDGAKNVSTSPTLDWTNVSGALSYSLQYTTDSKFQSNVVEFRGIARPPYSLTGLSANETYYWRIQAVDMGGTSEWSNDRKFTTGSGQLAAPRPFAPTDGEEGVSTSPTLSWEISPGALSYALQYTTDKNFKNDATTIDGIGKTSYTLDGLLKQQTYYWRVRASNSAGTSIWSVEWKFTTGESRLAAPDLLSPSDGAEKVSTSPTLEWIASIGASSYTLQYTKDKNFKNDLIEVSGLLKTFCKLDQLPANETFYWRVRAADAGSVSSWSREWSFTTGSSRLTAPQLILPLDGAIGVSIDPTLEWAPSSGATAYMLQYATDKNFKKDTITVEGLVGTRCSLFGLSKQQTYYWRVRASDASTASDWSAEWEFKTGTGRLSAPTLLAPSDAASGVSITPTLHWLISSGAASYTLQVAKDKHFKKDLVEVAGITKTSFTLSELTPNELYYWRVCAKGITGISSDWSLEWAFTTGSGRLGAPALIYPEDKAEVPVNPTLRWSTSEGATSYSVQVSTDGNFKDFVVNSGGLNATSLTIAGLKDHEKYYWRVRALSPIDSSDWTTEWEFRVSSTVTAVDQDNAAIPAVFKLFQNYPNPFNPSTTIEFSLPRAASVRILIYNMLGDLVHTLVDETLPPGTHQRHWVASGVATGIYFYRIQAGGFVDTKRLVLIK